MISSIASFFQMIYQMLQHALFGVMHLFESLSFNTIIINEFVSVLPSVVVATITVTFAVLIVKFIIDIVGALIP